MRQLAVVLIASCTYHRGAVTGSADATPDVAADGAMVDGRSIARLCAADPALVLCYSFDAAPLPATLPDQGTAVVDAQLTNVTRTTGGPTGGGAALLDATSEIYVPYTSQVTGIQAIEVWFRIDTDAPQNGRSGLMDSNVSPPNISLFFYRQDPAPHTLRCGIGGETIVVNATLPVGQWLYVACVCDAGSLAIYVDGTSVGSVPGPCASGGAFVSPDGFTIGSNNNGGPTGVNDWLIGAIDGLRLWNVTLSAATVCQHAGHTNC